MSYLREIKLQELIDWLVAVKYDELNEQELAQKMVNTFDILTYSQKIS